MENFIFCAVTGTGYKGDLNFDLSVVQSVMVFMIAK